MGEKYPAFQAGGVVAISGDAGRAVSAAVGGSLSQGLLVVSGEDKEACTTQLNAIGDVALAKVAAASDLLDMAPEALARSSRGARTPVRCMARSSLSTTPRSALPT